MQYFMTPKRHGLGWVPDKPDERDYIFRPKVVAPMKLPPAVDLRTDCPPVYNQGQLGSCTANALGAAFDFDRRKEGKRFMTPSRLFIYWNERNMEGTVDSDSGASIRDGVKVLVKLGTPPETDWPYDIAQFTVRPPEKAYQDAEKNQALQYQRILRPRNDPVHDMLVCLSGGYPFVSGITIYESFESEHAAATGHIPLPAEGEKTLGGHAIVVVGFDASKQHFVCRNSWGDDWGNHGYFYLPFAYLERPEWSSDQWLIRTVEI